jgi:hypothetical protein
MSRLYAQLKKSSTYIHTWLGLNPQIGRPLSRIVGDIGVWLIFKIHSALNRLVDWCGANSLELNVGKCKSITFLRIRHPVEFFYMLGGIIFDRVDSITDLGVVMGNG